MRSLAIGLLVLALPSLARSEAVRVLSVVGAGALRAGAQLAAESALAVPARTTVQPGLGEAVLALLGPARGRVSGRGLELYEAEAARLSGRGLLIVPGGFRVEVKRGGSVVFERGQLHVLAGRAVVSSPREELLGELLSPRSVRLGFFGELLSPQSALGAGTLRRLSRFQPPPPWRHALGPVSAAEVGRAVETVRAERQRERQAASCGCTESRGGSVGQLPGSGSALSPIERSSATLRVRITGIPRSAP